jgi:hypothetical protein
MTSLHDRTSLEDRIKAATRAAASTVPAGSAPPLQLPPGPQSPRPGLLATWRGAHSRAVLLRIGTPVAAAAAVLAVVATSLALAGGSRPPAPSASLAGVPPYYLALISSDPAGAIVSARAAPSISSSPAPSYPGPTTTGSSPSPAPSYTGPSTTAGGEYAVIQDVVTGATVATVLPPRPFDTFEYATGAADDRTFVLAAQNLSKDAGILSCGPTELFLARLDPIAGTVKLTPLPIPEFPATSRVDGIALSPDGTRLAVALARGHVCANGVAMATPLPAPVKTAASAVEQVRVYSLPSDTVTTWHAAPQWDLAGKAGPNVMSWARDGTLAFNYPGAGLKRSGQGLWLLNTNAPGGSLLAHSRFAVSAYVPPRGSHAITSLPGQWVWSSAGVITPDGRTVVAPIERYPERLGVTGAAFAEFAASSGAEFQVRWLDQQRTRDPFFVPYYAVEWTNPSGSILVVAAPATRGRSTRSVFGVLSGDRFTPIPGAPALTGLIYLNPTTLVF